MRVRAILKDPRADETGAERRQRRLCEIQSHMLRISCRRCERIVEIQTADAVRLYGRNAVWKDVAERLLDNTCQQRLRISPHAHGGDCSRKTGKRGTRVWGSDNGAGMQCRRPLTREPPASDTFRSLSDGPGVKSHRLGISATQPLLRSGLSAHHPTRSSAAARR